MASKTWTVIDVEQDRYLESGEQAGTMQLADDKFAVRKWTRRGGLCDGVDVLQVQNGEFFFRVLPTRGMNIWDAEYRGERIGWNSPVRGPVHPKFVPLTEPSGLGWLEGFDEMLARCGLESNGAPEFDEQGRLRYPLHGRISNKPAHLVEVTVDGDNDEITVIGRVEETRFHFLKLQLTTTLKTRRGEAGFRLRDEITNLSGSPAEMQLLYHVNFGPPLLDPGARVVAPVKTVVPRDPRAASDIDGWDRYGAEQAGFEEQVYFLDLLQDEHQTTRVMLRNAQSTRAVSLQFDKQHLPCFSVWKNTTTGADGYVTGLEPGTNFPNPRSYEGQQRRVAELPPGGTVAFELGLELHGDAPQVKAAEQLVAQIQGDVEPRIYSAPQPGWCVP